MATLKGVTAGEGVIETTPAGVRFTRGRISAKGRGTPREYLVPWSQVQGARLSGGRNADKHLRVAVAGHTPPPGVESDKYGLALARKGSEEARAFAEQINQSAAWAPGTQPAIAPGVEDPTPRSAPGPQGVPRVGTITPDPTVERFLRSTIRLNDLVLWTYLAQLGCLLIPAVIFFGVVVFVLLKMMF